MQHARPWLELPNPWMGTRVVPDLWAQPVYRLDYTVVPTYNRGKVTIITVLAGDVLDVPRDDRASALPCLYYFPIPLALAKPPPRCVVWPGARVSRYPQ
jgi:hypothetical protein